MILVNSSIFYIFTRENYTILVDLSPMDDATKKQLYLELRQILGWLLLGNACFLGVIAFIGLVYSHRTVGPLYHFKRVFEDIKNGNMKARVRLRPKDDFHDVALAFNEMMDAVAKREP